MLHASCLCCRKCTGTVLQRSAAAVGHLSLCAASRGGGEETAKIRTRFNLLRSMFHFSSVRWECVQSGYFFWICRGLLKLISNCNTHLPGSLQCSVLAVTVYNWLRLLHILDAVTDFSPWHSPWDLYCVNLEYIWDYCFSSVLPGKTELKQYIETHVLNKNICEQCPCPLLSEKVLFVYIICSV